MMSFMDLVSTTSSHRNYTLDLVLSIEKMTCCYIYGVLLLYVII